ncbi:MAG TPA: hypothetical protein VL972_10130 [Solirubrobacteraceae bacterium]|nr:hypothetical protein [Solirubrobacteraceae bacterium]
MSGRVFSREGKDESVAIGQVTNESRDVSSDSDGGVRSVDGEGESTQAATASTVDVHGAVDARRPASPRRGRRVFRGAGTKTDVPQLPSLEEFGRLGASYLLSERLWVRRHVETAALKNRVSAKRRLTIDVELPREIVCSVSDGRTNLYFLPVTLLAKRPITAFIDLVDEDDRSLPLLTREENASVSLAAVVDAGRRLLGAEPPSPLQRAWSELIHRDGLDAVLALHIAEDLTKRWFPEVEERPGYRWFRRALHDLVPNSFVWIPLEGRGGERRVVKLRYEATAGSPKLRHRKDATIEVVVTLDDGLTHEFTHTEPGDSDPRGIVGRVFNRLGNALGLTSTSVELTTPSIRGSSTYHLQFEAPPGLEVERLELLTEKEQRRGAFQERPKQLVENDGDSAHLYLPDSEVYRPPGTGDYRPGMEDSRMLPVLAELRVGRRGFLSLSTLSGMLIVAMLWAYDAAAPIHLVNSRPEVAAAVLLVVPVVLLAFVVQAGEHPVVTKMLVGVRVCMLTLGLLAIADAAAIVAVKPSAWSLHHTWFVYAAAGSIFGGLLVLGWVLALGLTRRAWGGLNSAWQSRLMYSVCCVALGALVGIALGAGDLDTGAVNAIPALGIVVPLLLALACWPMLAAPAARGARLPAGLCCVAGTVAVAASSFSLEGAIDGLRWHDAWGILAATVVVAIVLLVAGELIRFAVEWKRAGNSEVVGEPF